MNPMEARRSLSISVVAYEALCGLVFVRVPNERGRWVLTDRCVAEVDCPYCKSVSGEPCKQSLGAFWGRDGFQGDARTAHYGVGVHNHRKNAWRLKRQSAPRDKPKPKLRVRVEDMEAAMGEDVDQP